jgi:PIN domain nuclease of toxin-antitoxin system
LKLLLDSHAILWWVRDDRRLGREARRAIAGADVVWVSTVSGWELAIKVAKGRLRILESLRATIVADRFTELPLTLRHTEELERLPAHHRDPHDRLLIAQARVESATIVTHDRAFEAYGVPVLWT